MKIWQKIKSYLFALEFAISILLVIVAMLIFRKHNHAVRRIWGRSQCKVANIKVRIIGKFEDVDMIIINHQSMLDIVVLEAFYHRNLCWVAKKEIEKIPVFGKVISVPKMISIDRSDKRAIVGLINSAKERLSDGRVIAIFPEGTRAKSAELLKFKSGAKILAEKLNLKVQPVVLVNTRRLLDSQNMQLNGGELKIIAMPVIDRSDENWLENTRLKMQEQLNLHSQD